MNKKIEKRGSGDKKTTDKRTNRTPTTRDKFERKYKFPSSRMKNIIVYYERKKTHFIFRQKRHITQYIIYFIFRRRHILYSRLPKNENQQLEVQVLQPAYRPGDIHSL